MKKETYKVTVILGSDAVREYFDNSKATIKSLKTLGDVVKITFSTKAELDAYLTGLSDSDGWLDYAIKE